MVAGQRMAVPARHRAFVLLSIVALAGLSFSILSLSFTGALADNTLRHLRPASRRTAYESGKVNVGAEIKMESEKLVAPMLDCDEACMTAIYDCLEDGCSIEALQSLDQKLAEDESKIVSSMRQLQAIQKTDFSEENTGTLAWLNNFLGRSGSLRAQLKALRGLQDSDFVKQMIKAAGVAFGGGRHGNYPKVGVSPYSA